LDLLKDPVTFWFIIGLACVIAEFFAPGVIIVFFGVGAWVVSLLCLGMPLNVPVQITIFVVVSIGSLVLLRRRFNPRTDSGPDLTEDFIGRTAVVLEPVQKGRPGRVTFKGAAWKAETRSEEPLEKGRHVSIVRHDSIVLFVEPVPEEEQTPS
jgi:membrane protein implicated in regulation of membrane protease activity